MTFFTWCQFALVCLLGAVSPGPSLALIVYNSINYNLLSGKTKISTIIKKAITPFG